MKKLPRLLALTVSGIFTIGLAYADNPIPCPSLQTGFIFYVDGSEVDYNLSAKPFDNGFVDTNGRDITTVVKIANNALQNAIPSGNATKVYEKDGKTYFYACDSSVGNYNLVAGALQIFVATPDYSSSGKLSSVQHSINEKLERLKRR